jgi:hypothetical protein
MLNIRFGHVEEKYLEDLKHCSNRARKMAAMWEGLEVVDIYPALNVARSDGVSDIWTQRADATKKMLLSIDLFG